MFELVGSVLAGVGLAAACGLRVFVPLLALSIAATLDVLPLANDFAWIASTPALIAFATATVLEIGAYYVPWLDNLLDTIATPAAVAAGIVTSAALITDVSPVLRWALAIVAGGGVAGAVQGATVVTRLKSSAATAGVGNPIVATGETVGAGVTSWLAIVVPILAFVLVIAMLVGIFVVARRFAARASAGSTVAARSGTPGRDDE
jgi:hypothetical protein